MDVVSVYALAKELAQQVNMTSQKLHTLQGEGVH